MAASAACSAGPRSSSISIQVSPTDSTAVDAEAPNQEPSPGALAMSQLPMFLKAPGRLALANGLRYFSHKAPPTAATSVFTMMSTQADGVRRSPSIPWTMRPWVKPAMAPPSGVPVSYTHLRAHETRHDLVC